MRPDRVPVDYAKPDGDVASLALIRFPATGEKIGSLIINPGGPGESGIEAAASIVEQPARRGAAALRPGRLRPARGRRRPRPALWCNSDDDNDKLRADPQVDYSPEGVEHIESQTKAFIQRCVDKMGKDFLANVGTTSVAKDLDAIRAAVGDDKLTYLGYSYGTRIGAAYAEAYPDKVRAMILDGAVDPNADPIEADIDQAAAFQQAFNDYAADCAKDPTCPLGTDPAKAVDVYRDLVDPLVDKPMPHHRPARPGLQRRDHRHHHGAVLAEPVAAPDPGAHRDDRRPRRHHAGAGRHVHAPRRPGALHQRHRRPDRGQLRRPAGRHRPATR